MFKLFCEKCQKEIINDSGTWMCLEKHFSFRRKGNLFLADDFESEQKNFYDQIY